MKRIIAMIDANNLIVPLAGFIIVGLISIVAFSGKSWLTDFNKTTKKILDGLDDIKNQINDLKLENQIQTANMHEIEARTELRFQGVERRLEAKSKKLYEIENKVNRLEKESDTLKLYHKRNHPEDGI